MRICNACSIIFSEICVSLDLPLLHVVVFLWCGIASLMVGQSVESPSVNPTSLSVTDNPPRKTLFQKYHLSFI